MDRPREWRKDLPPGLYFEDGLYWFRGTVSSMRRYFQVGRVDREAAIKAWVKITARVDCAPVADTGTVAEVIDRHIGTELNRKDRTGVNLQRIRALLSQRRIPGARRVGREWFVPEDFGVTPGTRGPKLGK